VRDKPPAAVVPIYRSNDVDAAVSIPTDVEETAVRCEPERVKPAVAVDEGDTRDIVAYDAVKEAVASTG
jgi:hypothetical protein